MNYTLILGIAVVIILAIFLFSRKGKSKIDTAASSETHETHQETEEQ